MSSRNDHSFSLVGRLAVLMLIAGGVTAWFTFNGLNNSQTGLKPENNTPLTVGPSAGHETSQTSAILPKETIQVYWVKLTESKTELVPASVTINTSEDQTNQIKAALNQLLAGDKINSTLIPVETKLLDCKVEKNGIHLNFSKEFNTGGGTASLIGRLAQVIYTATETQNKAKVWLNIEGKPMEILGDGDGLMVEQPMTREKFRQDYQL